MDNTYRQRFDNGRSAVSTRYTIPNILNTYIRTSLAYRVDEHNNYSKSISVDRPFFSPFAKWGAGVYIGQDFTVDSLPDATGRYAAQNFKVGTRGCPGRKIDPNIQRKFRRRPNHQFHYFVPVREKKITASSLRRNTTA
ncbi:hypothetical protein H9W95_11655 [Flavobacterium lindanitolerans]|nr:hypothetical protein [Flavobacterium lindanitolerans]